MKLTKKYSEYLSNFAEYQKIRKELLRGPEVKLHEIAEDLNIYKLRKEVAEGVKKLIAKGWRLYRKIYNGAPTEAEIDKFITLAEEVMTYEGFISEDMIVVWRVSRDLVWAYKEAFKGTQDEYDQKEIE